MDWGKKLEELGVLWRMNYDNPSGAHALFTSGMHADGYCNCAKIVVDPAFTSQVAAAMIEKVVPKLNGVTPDFVIGPAYGAVTFAHEVAKQLGVKFAFTEIDYTDEGKMQALKRFDIPEGAKVLVIEDMKSTGGSAIKTISVLEEAGIEVLPVVGLVGNWSGDETIGDKEVVSLFSEKLNIWEADECPLCKNGSEAVRPKGNWDKLAR
ncbi:MAG: orotate phosphoribosyltransferase [Candidatus Azotimanducaceae bacterium]|jgi:orotate phosphoribosyltransferase